MRSLRVARPALVASDLDGTLFNAEKVIDDRTAAAVDAMARSGIVVAAATGRSAITALPRLTVVEGISYAVCSDGAALWDLTGREPILGPTWPVPAAVAARLVDGIADVEGATAFWETVDGVGWSERTEMSASLAEMTHRQEDAGGPVPLDGAPVLGVFAVFDRRRGADLAAMVEALAGRVPAGLSISSVRQIFVQMVADDVTKATALGHLARELGIDRREVAMCGDADNDIAALEWAGTAVVTENATADARSVADVVAGHHDRSGLAVLFESWANPRTAAREFARDVTSVGKERGEGQ